MSIDSVMFENEYEFPDVQKSDTVSLMLDGQINILWCSKVRHGFSDVRKLDINSLMFNSQIKILWCSKVRLGFADVRGSVEMLWCLKVYNGMKLCIFWCSMIRRNSLMFDDTKCLMRWDVWCWVMHTSDLNWQRTIGFWCSMWCLVVFCSDLSTSTPSDEVK